MPEKINHAIIGCGSIAPNHVDGVRRCPLSRLAVVCDRDEDVLRDFMSRHDLSQGTSDYIKVLKNPDIHSVSINVDHGSHAQLSREALLAGKHVLVEKPFTISLEDAHELTALARERGLVLAVVSQHRFDPLIRYIHRMVNTGELGKLISIWATLQCRRTPEYFQSSYWRGTWVGEGGSNVINQYYHVIDLVRWMGGPVSDVFAFTCTLRLGDFIETEDTMTGALRFASGALGSIATTSASEVRWRTRIDLIGTRGSLCFDIDHPDTLHFSFLEPKVESDLRAFLKKDLSRDTPPPGKGYYGISHRYQIDEFMRAIAGEIDRVSVAGEQATETLELIMRIYDSARQGSIA